MSARRRSLPTVSALLAACLLVLTLLPVPSAHAAGQDPPRNVTAVASASTSQTIEVTWEAPEGDAPTGYVIRIDRLSADDVWEELNRTREVTGVSRQIFDGLVNGATYRARVRAISLAGVGDATSGSAVPYGRPGRPVISSAEPGDGEVSLVWSAPSDNGRPITAYTISYAQPGSAAETIDVSGSTTSRIIDNLINNTEYTFRVTATNLRGDGDQSALMRATPTDNGGTGEDNGPPGNGGPDDNNGAPGDEGTDDGQSEDPADDASDSTEEEPDTDDQTEGAEDSTEETTGDDDATDGGDDGDEHTSDPDDGTSDDSVTPTPGDQPSGEDDGADGADPTPDPDAAEDQAFSDVAPESTHGQNVARLVELGITEGCGDGRFCPSDPVTRQQMATFLVRALRLPASDIQPFIDVPDGSTHAANIRALAAFGVTRGCTEDRFCPADPVTRGQMASFIARGFSLPAPEVPVVFDDVAADHPHLEGIQALAEAGVTRGCTETEFCPSDLVTREQMASFIVRALDHAHDRPPDPND